MGIGEVYVATDNLLLVDRVSWHRKIHQFPIHSNPPVPAMQLEEVPIRLKDGALCLLNTLTHTQR